MDARLPLSLLVFAPALISACRPQAAGLVVTPIRDSGIYALNEPAGWTITVPAGADNSGYTYTLKANNSQELKTGPLDLSSGKATIEVSLAQPAMLYLEIKPASGRPQAFGAAVAPTALKPVAPRPRDFDAFWRSKIRDLETVPENAVITPADSGKDGVDYGTIQMDLNDHTHVYGQIAKPSKPGKYPAILILQWASPPYPLQKPWVIDRAAEGWLALNIEPHDVLPCEAQSYYAALPDPIKHYEGFGNDDRDKSYFLDMYLRDYRAVDYLTHRPDWDGRVLVVTGGSMGGQQSLCVAGLHPKVTHVIVEEPAGCDLQAGLHERQEGYPFFPVNNPKVMATAPYFDCVNFASHIHATSLVAMGFIDTGAPPTGIWTAFNQIRGPKEVVPLRDAAHNNIATYEQQLPYYRKSGEWLHTLVTGGTVTTSN